MKKPLFALLGVLLLGGIAWWAMEKESQASHATPDLGAPLADCGKAKERVSDECRDRPGSDRNNDRTPDRLSRDRFTTGSDSIRDRGTNQDGVSDNTPSHSTDPAVARDRNKDLTADRTNAPGDRANDESQDAFGPRDRANNDPQGSVGAKDRTPDRSGRGGPKDDVKDKRPDHPNSDRVAAADLSPDESEDRVDSGAGRNCPREGHSDETPERLNRDFTSDGTPDFRQGDNTPDGVPDLTVPSEGCGNTYGVSDRTAGLKDKLADRNNDSTSGRDRLRDSTIDNTPSRGAGTRDRVFDGLPDRVDASGLLARSKGRFDHSATNAAFDSNVTTTGIRDRTRDHKDDQVGRVGGGGGGCNLVANGTAKAGSGLAYLLVLLAPVAFIVARRFRR